MDSCGAQLDPRVKRTRLALAEALARLLDEHKSFESLSVAEIADAAGVNRATFYDHYADKFVLLECSIATKMDALLAQRGVVFEGCASALRGMALGICDFLAAAPGMACGSQPLMESHLESAVANVIRKRVLEGLQRHEAPASGVSPGVVAASVSWAMLGAAKEWVRMPDRMPAEQMADQVMDLVGPMYAAATAEAAAV